MKKNLMKSALMFMALGAVVFTSCSKDELETPEIYDGSVRFTSAVNAPAPTTKASGAAWAANDKVGIFMVGTGTTTIAENAENREYTTTGTNSFTAAGNEIYYPVNTPNAVDFIAYYPFAAGQTLTTGYPVNVSAQTSQAAIDLLYSNNATNKTKANTSVAMNFDHKLSKVIINTTAGEGLVADDLKKMTVTIKGMNTKAPFDLSAGTLGTYSDLADITALPATIGSKYEAIVLPATFAANALTMEFALNNGKSEVFKRVNTATEDFVAGKVYTYNIIVKRTGVEFTCTITDWDTTPADRTGDAE